MDRPPSYRKNAYILTALILLIGAGSTVFLLLRLQGPASDAEAASPVADIYQDGTLLYSIPLSPDREPYTFVITGDGDRSNTVQIKNGQIGILSASCPDKLCVRQRFHSTSLLPIVCLPNRLVIRIREENAPAPDAVTY